LPAISAWGRRDHDRMVVGFTTTTCTCAFSADHHWVRTPRRAWYNIMW